MSADALFLFVTNAPIDVAGIIKMNAVLHTAFDLPRMDWNPDAGCYGGAVHLASFDEDTRLALSHTLDWHANDSRQAPAGRTYEVLTGENAPWRADIPKLIGITEAIERCFIRTMNTRGALDEIYLGDDSSRSCHRFDEPNRRAWLERWYERLQDVALGEVRGAHSPCKRCGFYFTSNKTHVGQGRPEIFGPCPACGWSWQYETQVSNVGHVPRFAKLTPSHRQEWLRRLGQEMRNDGLDGALVDELECYDARNENDAFKVREKKEREESAVSSAAAAQALMKSLSSMSATPPGVVAESIYETTAAVTFDPSHLKKKP